MGNPLPLTNAERLAATLLSFLFMGVSAEQARAEAGAMSVTVTMPTEDKLRAIRDKAPVAVWHSALQMAEAFIADVKGEPRPPMQVLEEVAGIAKKAYRDYGWLFKAGDAGALVKRPRGR